MGKVRKFPRSAGALVAALIFGAVGVLYGGWTQNYDCDETADEDYHIVDNGATDWADNTHEYIPGNCDVHENYRPPPSS